MNYIFLMFEVVLQILAVVFVQMWPIFMPILIIILIMMISKIIVRKKKFGRSDFDVFRKREFFDHQKEMVGLMLKKLPFPHRLVSLKGPCHYILLDEAGASLLYLVEGSGLLEGKGSDLVWSLRRGRKKTGELKNPLAMFQTETARLEEILNMKVKPYLILSNDLLFHVTDFYEVEVLKVKTVYYHFQNRRLTSLYSEQKLDDYAKLVEEAENGHHKDKLH